MRAVVVGIGQTLAGDDGVGPAVIRELRKRGVPRGVELVESADPLDLVDWLQGTSPVIVVDALVGQGEPGEIVEIRPESLSETPQALMTTHSVGVAQALDLAKAVSMNGEISPVVIVGIRVLPPTRRAEPLSRQVALAVRKAAALVSGLI